MSGGTELTAAARGSPAILQAGFIYAAANALSAGVPFLLLPVLTRALSPSDYGMVVSFFLLVTFSNSFAGLNVHSATGVQWFKHDTRDFPAFMGTALLLAGASTLLCGAILFGCAPLLQTRLQLPTPFWFLAAVQTGATIVVGSRTILWQSQGYPFRSAGLQVAAAVLNVALSLLGVFVFELGGAGRIVGSVVASVLSAATAVGLLFSSGDAKWSASAADMRWLLRFGIPLIPYALAGALLATADRFSVAAILGQGSLGIYGTAAQLGFIVNVLSDAFIKASSPWMYSQLARQTSRSRLRLVGATYLLIPGWLTVAVMVWLALLTVGSFILDSRYQPAIGLSLWFLLAGGVTAIGANICGLFFFTSKNEWLTITTVAAAMLATVLAPALAGWMGLQGAAVSFFCVQVVVVALAWILSLRIQPMPWQRPMLAVRALTRTWKSRS